MFRRGVRTVVVPMLVRNRVRMNTFGSSARLGPGNIVCKAMELAARLIEILENLSPFGREHLSLLLRASPIVVEPLLDPRRCLSLSLWCSLSSLIEDRAMLMQTGLSRRTIVTVLARLPAISVFLAIEEWLTCLETGVQIPAQCMPTRVARRAVLDRR